MMSSTEPLTNSFSTSTSTYFVFFIPHLLLLPPPPPLPPPPLQAKVDLASVLEESAAAGKKASEATSAREAAQAEHRETKARLESEEAANAGLKAAVMEANEVHRG